MISTQTSTRPEAMIPPASLATDFDEWMAGWSFKFSGTKYTGKLVSTSKDLTSNAWSSFKQEPRRSPSPEGQLSPRIQFIASITPPKNGKSTFSSPRSHSRDSSFGSSISSVSTAPSIKQDPLFQTEFFEVRESPKGGYGAFATKDIEVGTIVQREEPAFRAIIGDIYFEYERLSTEQRAEYRSLYGWSAFGSQIISIFKTNRFETSGPRSGIFLKSSRFNHACHPHATCTYKWIEEENVMVFTAINSIKAGQEITIQYTGNPATLYPDYGFYCDCPACPDPKHVVAQKLYGRHDY